MRLFPTILVFIIFLLSATPAQPRELFGWLNGERIVLNDLVLESNGDCKKKESAEKVYYDAQWQQIDAENARLVLSMNDEKEKLADIHLRKRIVQDGGVAIAQWSASDVLIKGVQTKIILRHGMNGYAVDLCKFCPDAGWAARDAFVLIRPAYRRDAERWWHEKGYGWKKVTYESDFGRPKNLYQLELPIGSEHEAISDLLKQPWVFDAERSPREAGPEETFVFFRIGSIFHNAEDQQALREKLITVLKHRFGSLVISKENVVAYRRGLSYKLKLKAPLAELGNHDFKGYWLKADAVLEFTRQELKDELAISIPDGFIAKWDKNGTPP